MTADSGAVRQKRRRDKNKANGWVKTELWTYPEDVPLAKAIESVSQDSDGLDIIDYLKDIVRLIKRYRGIEDE